MVDVAKIVEGFERGFNREEIAEYADTSKSSVTTYLRREGLIPNREVTEKVKKVIRARSLGMNIREAAEYVGTDKSMVSRIWTEKGLWRPSLEESITAERFDFLDGVGLDRTILDGFGIPETMTDVQVMRGSYEFFEELGADLGKTFRDYPSLLTHHRDSDLEPKLQFLVDVIGIAQEKVARKPDLFTYSLDSMREKYRHYARQFGNEKQAKAMLRKATTVFGNDTDLIDEKIRAYQRARINFHRNYTLLELAPEKVIATRDYLRGQGVRRNEALWYYMLLTVGVETLKPKVEYCEKVGVNWRKCPRILVLGLGTKKKPGALPRRVNMIKQAFPSRVPKELDYRINPIFLDNPDKNINDRIRRFKSLF